MNKCIPYNLESGLSYHHGIISTKIKPRNFKGPPKKKMYWSYKNINLDTFLKTLEMELDTIRNKNYYILFK